MEQNVPLIGLTGGMGAGKSTALQALERLGAAVQSSDAVVHELYEGAQLRDAVVARWGQEVAPGGVVDRAEVARRAFADEEGRAWLEATVWPLVGERMGSWLAQARALEPAPRAIVIEVPLLFEAGMEGTYDATIAVVAAEELRERRAAAPRARAHRRARGAPAEPGGEGGAGDVCRGERRQRGGAGAGVVGRAG